MSKRNATGTMQHQRKLHADARLHEEVPQVLKAGKQLDSRVGTGSVKYGQDGCGY